MWIPSRGCHKSRMSARRSWSSDSSSRNALGLFNELERAGRPSSPPNNLHASSPSVEALNNHPSQSDQSSSRDRDWDSRNGRNSVQAKVEGSPPSSCNRQSHHPISCLYRRRLSLTGAALRIGSIQSHVRTDGICPKENLCRKAQEGLVACLVKAVFTIRSSFSLQVGLGQDKSMDRLHNESRHLVSYTLI